jgi:hypothetical protein
MSAPTNTRQKAAAVIVLISILAILSFFFVKTMTKNDNSSAAPAPTADCATTVHFFSQDVGNNFFGPAADGNVDGLKKELHNRRCQDPALTVAHANVEGLPDYVGLQGDDQFAAKTRELIADQNLWRATVAVLESKENSAKAEVVTMSGSYQTLYMLNGVTDVPLIRKASPDRPEFAVLRFTGSNGFLVNFKLDCGFQPVAQEFPGIPSVPPGTPNQPTPGPSPTPTTPPTTAPPCPSGKCVPPVTTPPPPTTTPPPATTPTTLSHGDSGDGAYWTIPTPTTQAPALAPPITQAPLVNPPGPPAP